MQQRLRADMDIDADELKDNAGRVYLFLFQNICKFHDLFLGCVSIYALYLRAWGLGLYFARSAGEGRRAPPEPLDLFRVEKRSRYTVVQTLLRDGGVRPAQDSGVEGEGRRIEEK
jgi:hypothetical protein